ncbi:MAG: hypothetical protein HYZ46_01410 [Nitrosomonadales bacterium]|nr:hypothetical protein [Nitrosomonadales bacterium]
MTKQWIIALVLAGLVSSADAQPQSNASRAELLYTTHCIACHDADIHWREKKLATDWLSLKVQVSRWQRIGGLGWSDDDIAGVAGYLNARHYHYPEQAGKSPREPASSGKASPKRDQQRR